MESRFVRLGEEDFHLLAAGSEGAPPVLLLHGFPEYSGAWTEVAAHLCPRFRVIAPDQRGYGRSPAPAEVRAYALRRLVADMAALVEPLAPVTAVGHDWGASVAYGLAIFRPELVSRLVILNGVHPIPFQRALAAGGAQAAASQYIPKLRAPGAEARLAEDGFARLLRMFPAGMDMGWMTPGRLAHYRREWSRPGRLTGMLNWYRASPLVVPPPGQPLPDPPVPDADALRVRVPHLLVWGTADTALLPDATEGLEALCDDLTRVEVPGTDHWLHHQKPREVARLIAEFAGATAGPRPARARGDGANPPQL